MPGSGNEADLEYSQEGTAGNERIEVSVFGPGYGESIALNFGNQSWMIVDSCLGDDGVPAAVQYLQSIGVDPAVSVKLIVITHWDDDHVKGMGHTVEVCESAEVLIPAACQAREVWAFVGSDAAGPVPPGLRELKRVIEVLDRRRRRGEARALRIAMEDVALHDAVMETSDPPIRIWALSPSSGDRDYGLSQIGQAISQLPLKRLDQNVFSVVLHIQIGEQAILLGGDRLATPAARGWGSVLEASRRRGVKPASLLKVPHHGSRTAHHDGMWDVLTGRPVVSVLTPNVKSAGLPRKEDVERLCAISDVVAISSHYQDPKTREPVSAYMLTDVVEYVTEAATLEQDGLYETRAQPRLGMVRCRASPRRGGWEIHTPEPAARLK